MGEMNSSYYDGYNYALAFAEEQIDEVLKDVHPSEKRLIDVLLDLKLEYREAVV